jgi:mlo protein
MAGGGGGDVRMLDVTPTWAVAAVCAVIVIISILLEKLIHKFAKVLTYIKIMLIICYLTFFFIFMLWIICNIEFFQVFEERKKHALLEALEKIKAGKKTTRNTKQ